MTTEHLDPSLEAEALRALFSVLPIAIVLFDAGSKRLELNGRAAELLGVEAVGSEPAQLTDMRPGWENLGRALESTAAVRQLEIEVLAGSELRKLFVDTFPLAAGSGSVGVLHRPPRAGGEDLVAHLAHKLNNPLSTILMSAQLAADGSGASNPERLARLLGKIQDNARRCGKILEEAVNGGGVKG